VLVRLADRVTLDLRINGNRAAMTSREQIFAVGVAGATNLQIPRLVCREVRGDCLYVSQSNWGTSGTETTDLEIGDLISTNSADDGRNALSLISGKRVTVRKLQSVQVGGTVNSLLMPGGIDIEPDHDYQVVEDVVIGEASIRTAGTSGFQILGRSATGNYATRDWTVQRISVGTVALVRTGTTGSGLSASNLIRVKDLSLESISTTYINAYGAGWNLDYADRVSGTMRAAHVTNGVVCGFVDEVRDFDLRVFVNDYNTAGLKTTLVTRGRFAGKVANHTSGTTFAIQGHSNARGTITQTSVTYSVDAPYHTSAGGTAGPTRAFRNEPTNAVAFAATVVCDCDWSGYANPPATWDSSVATAFKINVRGIETTAIPTSGSWNQGEFVPNSTPSEAGSGGSKYVLTGWVRLTTGTANVANTDWVPARSLMFLPKGHFNANSG
jgi:hypothetical protein